MAARKTGSLTRHGGASNLNARISGNGALAKSGEQRSAVPSTDPTTFTGLYGVAVVGDCMAPDYPDGCLAKVSPEEPYDAGDVVVVWFRPEIVAPGRAPAMIKRIVVMPPPWVESFPYKESLNSEVRAAIMLGRDDRPDEMFGMKCAHILAIHKCIGILEPERVSMDFRSAAERDLAAHRAKFRAVPK